MWTRLTEEQQIKRVKNLQREDLCVVRTPVLCFPSHRHQNTTTTATSLQLGEVIGMIHSLNPSNSDCPMMFLWI